ncbi:hypothetical protein [Cryptosporangium aurantiacum]|uniref:Uncharacterized protein n=1 Tax=Cryptosporangium aurantiacum TaxID=134849 RepID=A0A1M7RMI4_9ACTN|nr:hypothetical protein [Cryptosporangium aurantiacum]SHN47401.1 hypothetical protein SAMN05443668_12347 [Cryptosporangium aurantiacum]
MTNSEPATVFVIDVNDRFAHLFSSVTDLLATHEAAPAEPPRGLDFFDQDGQRLAPVFDETWRLSGLVKTDEKPEPEAVQARLVAVFAFLAQYTTDHPSQISEDFGLSVDEALRELPQLNGKTLAESIAALRGLTHEAAPEGHQQDRGSWFHNLMHNI